MAAERSRKRQDSSADAAAFTRRKRPVRVRRGVSDWRSWPWRRIGLFSVLLFAGLGSLDAIEDYVAESPRFRFPADGSGLVTTGLDQIDPEIVRSVFATDFGMNVGGIDLAARRAALVAAPWVRTAAVSRIWPNRIWADLVERKPIAYVRLPRGGASETVLIDSDGVLLDPPAGRSYEAPIADGFDRDMPASERVKRVRLIETMLADLDSADPRLSERVSQVDVSDWRNARVTTVHDGEVVQLQMGDKRFRHRFEVFLRYIGDWKRKYSRIAWIDLRFAGQVVIQPLDAPSDAEPRRQPL